MNHHFKEHLQTLLRKADVVIRGFRRSPSYPLQQKPKKGDKIYVPGFLHITHGVDDFAGGIVTVGGVRKDRIKGRPVTFVFIQEDGSWVNWDTFLAPMQGDLRTHFGIKGGKPKPDCRAEFNE